jgi:hypothetical protein
VGRRFAHGHQRIGGKGEFDEPFEVVVIVLATDASFVFIDLLYYELEDLTRQGYPALVCPLL